MLNFFINHDLNNIVFKTLYVIFEAILYCYLKYMIDVKYYYFWNINFIRGVFDLIVYGFIFSLLYIIKTVNNNDILLKSLELYKEGKAWYIFFRILFGIIIEGFFNSIFEYQTINIFNPNYVFVCYEISKIPEILMNANNINDWLSIIPFTLQIIILLFYLEIFELNFCNLNKNTKKIYNQEKEQKAQL